MLQPHIQLDESVGAKYAILPGDPARVTRIAEQLTEPRELAFNREYRSVLGTYKGIPVLAMSTGMGGPAITIAIEELRQIGVTTCIRIGSCGAIQEGLGLGDLVLVQGAVRDDGASRTYVGEQYPAVPDFDLLNDCVAAARELGAPHVAGICRSHDSFYIDNEDDVSSYWGARGVIGSDMETATLLTVGRLRGLKCASILNNVVVWGESTADSIGSYAGGEDLTAVGERNEITVALEAFVRAEAALASS